MMAFSAYFAFRLFALREKDPKVRPGKVHIADASRFNVQNQDAVLGRFEYPPVPKF